MRHGLESADGSSEMVSGEADHNRESPSDQEDEDLSGPEGAQEPPRPRSRAPAEDREDRVPLWRTLLGADLPQIVGRIVLFLVLVAIVYAVVRQVSYVIFAPELSVVSMVPPPRSLEAGEPITLGIVVRNESLMSGASFVVAAFGDGVEVEGPTLDVPAGDTAIIPVQVTLPPGETVLSLVVFDGWRGVRRLRTLRGITVSVGSRKVPASDIRIPDQITRGELVTVSFPWRNPGLVRQTVVPGVIFRPQGGGPPVAVEGTPLEIQSGESATLEFTVDTWRLQEGRYSAEVFVRSQGGSRLGQGSSPLSVELIEP